VVFAYDEEFDEIPQEDEELRRRTLKLVREIGYLVTKLKPLISKINNKSISEKGKEPER